MEIRIRLNHTRTQKDGWRPDDDTVELSFRDGEVLPEQLPQTLVIWKHAIYTAGTQIAAMRNEAEGRA